MILVTLILFPVR
uniref:Uncharacterized protein n=1 Tax=Rhizophora mucronata TaxID=61149 RepID=A0A2P2PSD2_RHIMU